MSLASQIINAHMNSGDNTNMQWELVRGSGIDFIGKVPSSWMSRVLGDTKLNIMNMPATHQSLALHGVKSQGHRNDYSIGDFRAILDNPRCQNRSPYHTSSYTIGFDSLTCASTDGLVMWSNPACTLITAITFSMFTKAAL